MRPRPKLVTLSALTVVAITTSSVGIVASCTYCENGPWFNRSNTSGPGPKLYRSQLCAGTAASERVIALPVAPALPSDNPCLRKYRRFIARTALRGIHPEVACSEIGCSLPSAYPQMSHRRRHQAWHRDPFHSLVTTAPRGPYTEFGSESGLWARYQFAIRPARLAIETSSSRASTGFVRWI